MKKLHSSTQVINCKSEQLMIIHSPSQNYIKVIDMQTEINMQNILHEHSSFITSGVVSKSGRFAATGSTKGGICVWDTITGENLSINKIP